MYIRTDTLYPYTTIFRTELAPRRQLTCSSDGSPLCNGRTVEGVALSQADTVDVADDDGVRAEQPRLGVGDATGPTVLRHEARRLAQMRTRHGGEKVVLDLIVQRSGAHV